MQTKYQEYADLKFAEFSKDISIEGVRKLYSVAMLGIEQKDIQTVLLTTKRCKLLLYCLIYDKQFSELEKGENTDCVREMTMYDEFCKEKGIQVEQMEFWWDIVLFESEYLLESFILYMERLRPYEKKFYVPRRKTLKYVVKSLQQLEDGKYRFVGISMPSRSGKSTTCIFFLAWVMCKRPNSHSAMGGHSGLLARGFYQELLNFISTEEYTFATIYDYIHPGHEMIRKKSADEYTITLDEPDRFATVTCRGIDGTWTGAVDVSKDGYLYVDDLVRDRQHSLSPTRMEDTFQEYLNKMVDRKNDGAKELMVGTLWNVLDPLERMRQMYGDREDYLFLKIPALDENDESNFDYEVNGFSTEYYREMREKLDDAEWMAKFQQQPFVREGLLLPSDELNYFNGIMPDGDYRTIAVCDVAYGGGDNLSMPVAREYENGDTYIFDWVYSKAPKEKTMPMVVGAIIQNDIRKMRFEGNQGGDLYCGYVDDALRSNNYKCSCVAKKAPNQMAKMEKIVAYSGEIKRRFYFITPKKPTQEEIEQDKTLGVTRYTRSKDYQRAMDDVCSFVTIGKNETDDAVDSLTQMAIEQEGTVTQAVQAIQNPFRGGLYGNWGL